MAGVQHGVVGDLGQAVMEAVVQGSRIPTGEIGPTTALQKQCVAGHQTPVDQYG